MVDKKPQEPQPVSQSKDSWFDTQNKNLTSGSLTQTKVLESSNTLKQSSSATGTIHKEYSKQPESQEGLGEITEHVFQSQHVIE